MSTGFLIGDEGEKTPDMPGKSIVPIRFVNTLLGLLTSRAKYFGITAARINLVANLFSRNFKLDRIELFVNVFFQFPGKIYSAGTMAVLAASSLSL